jgi:hypothetical protein
MTALLLRRWEVPGSYLILIVYKNTHTSIDHILSEFNDANENLQFAIEEEITQTLYITFHRKPTFSSLTCR